MAEKRGAQFIMSVQFTLDEGETSQTIAEKIRAGQEEALALRLRVLDPDMSYTKSIARARRLLWSDGDSENYADED